MKLKERLVTFEHICRHHPTHKLCAERVKEALDDIAKLEAIIRETMLVNADHAVRCRPFIGDTDLSEVVSFPERLREVLAVGHITKGDVRLDLNLEDSHGGCPECGLSGDIHEVECPTIGLRST